MSDTQDQILPFSVSKQNAILGHILLNTDGFCQQAVHRMQPAWFQTNINSKIFGYIQRYCLAKGVPDSYREIVEYEDMRSEDTLMRHKISVAISIAMVDAEQIRLSAIKEELTQWMQAKILQDSLSESAQLWNRKDFKKSAAAAEAMIKKYYEAKFEDNDNVSFNNPEKWLAELEHSHKDCLTIGLPILDSYIMSNQTQGGLQRGASTVALAPINIGKSSFLITTAIHNVKKQKSILYMTHEDRFEDVRVRMLQCYLRRDINSLLELYKTESGLKEIKAATAEISKYIIYIPVNKPGMTVEEVIPTINRAQEKRKMSNEGRGFDLFVNDYPGKLSSVTAVNNQYRHTQDQVYDAFVQ